MKRLLALILGITAGLTLAIGTASADDAKARKIMEKVDAREDGDNMVTQMTMLLIDKNGSERKRTIKAFMKDKGEDTLRIMFFVEPADVKDTAFLTYDYDAPEKDDDQWLYLPALKKSKRIANDDKSGSFMGSDLNYSDMTKKNLQDYDYTLLKEADVNGAKVWVIESTPRSRSVVNETGYTKSVLFVRQDNFVVVRAVHWEKDGGTMKYFDVRNLQLIDGVWTNLEVHMTRKSGNETLHKTILTYTGTRYGQKLDEEMFTVRRIEKGL